MQIRRGQPTFGRNYTVCYKVDLLRSCTILNNRRVGTAHNVIKDTFLAKTTKNENESYIDCNVTATSCCFALIRIKELQSI